MRYAPGQVIAQQGEAADCFYLVRIGFVKISEDVSGRGVGAGVSCRAAIISERSDCWAEACERRRVRR